MRWTGVPSISGLTHPLGEVTSPYSAVGVMGPLRMAAGQPALVGEDLGYGADVVASNHYGRTTEVIYESRRSPVLAISDVLKTLRQTGRKAGLDTAAAISVREGVPVSEAAIEVIATRGMGEDDLARRIAKLETALASARAKRQRRRSKQLRVKIAALKMRLRDVTKGKKQAVRDMPGIAGDKGRIPPWVTWAGLALGAASLVVAVQATRKGKK
ncbi:hypothetical protein CMI37_07505 [Candidatus Pacearchaeota archaeon]|nr:hypothetical protein [Candidatus Pacearchaeota archaeon]